MRRARHLKTKAPKEYAMGAINELSRQLETAKTETKKTRLKSRIKEWQNKIEQE